MKLLNLVLGLALLSVPAIAGPARADKPVNLNHPDPTSLLSPFRTFHPSAGAHAMTAARRAEGKPARLPLPDNPAETLHCDGPNSDGVGLTNGGTFYGAVRFTPEQSCSLKTVVFLHFMPSSDDYVFIFGPGTSTSPGAVLDSMPYTGADSGWISLNLNAPQLVLAQTDIWVGIRLTHVAGVYPLGVDAGPMVQDHGGFIEIPGDTWQQLNGVGLDYNWNIWAIVEPVRFPRDVGTAAILAPNGMVTGDTIAPLARIENYGSAAAGPFDVRMTIDPGGYASTRTVTSLAPGDTATLTFDNWIPVGSGSFAVKCSTRLDSDAVTSNDSKTASALVVSFVQDFESTSGGYTPDGNSAPGWVWAAPQSPRPAAHSGSKVWAAPPVDSYPNYAQWELTSAGYVAFQDSPVIAFYHWYNFELHYDGGNVKYSTDGGTTWALLYPWAGYSAPYDDTVYTLQAHGYTGPGPSDWLLAMFQIPVASGTMFQVRWDLASDVSIVHLGWMIDDMAGIGCNMVPNDVGTDAVTMPSGMISPGIYQPQARVKNFGTATQGPFDVRMTVTPGSYLSTKSVPSLAPYDTVTVTFDDWTVPGGGLYYLRCTTLLAGDAAPNNDAKTDVAAIPSFVQDFETVNGGLTANPSSGAWEWGEPQPPRPGAHSGTKVWSAPLTGEYPDGADWQLFGLFEAVADTPVIAYWQWYSFERTYDGGNLKLSTDGGTTWSVIYPWAAFSRPYDLTISTLNTVIGGEQAYSGVDTTWRQAWFQIPVDSGAQFLLRWHMGTDASVHTYNGWMVDDLAGVGLLALSGIAAEPAPKSVNRFAVTPNPAHGLARLSYALAQPGELSIRLYSVSGRLITSLAQGRVPAGAGRLNLNTGSLASGVYVLKFESGRFRATRKLVVQ